MKEIFKNNRYIIFIIAAGVLARLWHINWGLPEIYEEATPLTISWKFWNWGQPGLNFNPHFFNYPALTFYLNFIAQAISYAVGHLAGSYPSLSSFGTSPVPLVVTSRLISVLFDAGTIGVVYLLAREALDERAGLLAALLAAFNPSHIRNAHLIQVDTALTFFSILSVLFIFRICTGSATKWYILAGISIGLAAASKYTGAFLLAVLVAGHLMKSPSIRTAAASLLSKELIYSALLACLVFILLNPYILLDYSEFQRDFSFEQYHVSYGHLGLLASQSTLGYYLLDVFPSSLGWGLIAVLAASTAHFLIRRKKGDLFLLIYPAVYIFILSTWEMRAERYILPVFTSALVIASIGVIRFLDYFKKEAQTAKLPVLFISGTARSVTMTIIVLLLIAQPLLNSYEYLNSLGLPDTRMIAKTWIKEHLQPGSAIATGPYGVEFPDSTYKMLQIPFLAFQAERVAPFYDARWYEDFDLLIASDYDYSRYIQEPQRYQDFLSYYDSLRLRWELLREITPAKSQTGPTFWLYRYPDSLKRNQFDVSLFQRIEGAPESSRVSNFLKDLGYIMLTKNKLEKGEQLLREILTVEIENITARNYLAQVLFNLGKYESTLRQLQLSLKYNENQPVVFALAGKALLRLNRPVEAEGVLLKALSLDSRFQPPYLDLIALYTSSNDKEKLADILTRYRAILPPNGKETEEVEKRLKELRGRG